MGARNDNTIIIIPALNEARTIGAIVKSVVASGFNVLVIDDGSSDATEREALDNGALVLRHKDNLGKGASIRSAIKYVLEKMNFEWIILMDGDGQHHPEDIQNLLKASEAPGSDMVIGNRMDTTHNMPFARYWTNRFTSWVLSKMSGQYIPDTQCGFRLLKASTLGKMKLVCNNYDIESEMIIEAAEQGSGIVSAPIQTIYGDESSKINPFRDTIKFFRLVSKHSLRKNGFRRKTAADGRDAAYPKGDRRS